MLYSVPESVPQKPTSPQNSTQSTRQSERVKLTEVNKSPTLHAPEMGAFQDWLACCPL